MERFFALFGKLALVLIVLGALAGGGYYLGRSGKVNFGPNTPRPGAASTTNPTPFVSPTATQMPKKTVTAGTPPDSGLSFNQYTVEVPQDWNANHTYENIGTPVDTLLITKGGYEIKIWQAATGGAICLFPGDTPFEGPQSTYTIFTEITGTTGLVFRRSTTAGQSPSGKKGFTVCQKSEAYGNFQLPTNFGHVSYTTPATPDEQILKEMDAIIASLKKML